MVGRRPGARLLLARAFDRPDQLLLAGLAPALVFVAAGGRAAALLLAFAPGLLSEDGADRLLAGGMVGRNVEELSGGLQLQAAELVDQALAGGPEMKAPMTSASTMSGSWLHCFEKR